MVFNNDYLVVGSGILNMAHNLKRSLPRNIHRLGNVAMSHITQLITTATTISTLSTKS